MDVTDCMLKVCRAKELNSQSVEQTWLIHQLWGKAAVGIIGGAPKCCKSWLGLDMAVSVASATPCLNFFPVHTPGKALVFLAEDALPAVRNRIDAICRYRGLDINQLDLYVITEQTIRLDIQEDQKKLESTLNTIRPKILILDPLVRLHCLDENSASDISKLLGFLRCLQRTFETAIVLVHHASKKHRAQPGQALRGSSDLHAFGDSNAYLARRDERIVLTLEHRAARPPEPIDLRLVSNPDGTATHLEIDSQDKINIADSLADRVLPLLQKTDKPLTRTFLRSQLKVNNHRLGSTLTELENKGVIVRSEKGWLLAPSSIVEKKTHSTKNISIQETLF